MAAIQGQGAWVVSLCNGRQAFAPTSSTGNLLLPGLIYSKDHLGPENNVFCDLEFVSPSLLTSLFLNRRTFLHSL